MLIAANLIPLYIGGTLWTRIGSEHGISDPKIDAAEQARIFSVKAEITENLAKIAKTHQGNEAKMRSELLSVFKAWMGPCTGICRPGLRKTITGYCLRG